MILGQCGGITAAEVGPEPVDPHLSPYRPVFVGDEHSLLAVVERAEGYAKHTLLKIVLVEFHVGQLDASHLNALEDGLLPAALDVEIVV